MEEVSGPVVSIALILASVFIPVAFMGGIQGSLNKQFAITIAISVLISAFNALTLSPALAAMWLRPRKEGPAARRVLPAVQPRVREGVATATSRVSRGADPQGGDRHRLLAGFAILAGGLGRRLPTSFVPEEDYGYFLLNVQLPHGRVAAADRRRVPEGRGDSGEDRRDRRASTRSSASAC